MPYIAKDKLEKARELDLLTYLQHYEPHELKHIRGDVYCTQTHDSLKISNGKWMWWSRGVGGSSALDYLIEVQGMTLPEAAERILGQAAIAPPAPSQPKPKEKTLLLPPEHSSTEQVRGYLEHRGIAPIVTNFCIQNGSLYESHPHHNAVFVGYDLKGNARYASLRGTQSDFKGEASGSDKRYSFSLAAKESDTLHLFESAIDVLSFATLLKLHKRDWRQDHLLSLSGIYQPQKELAQSKVPVALVQFLTDHPNIRHIVLRLDNDKAGRLAAQTLTILLSERYTVADKPPPVCKDYNDYLRAVYSPKQQHRERGNAR